MKKLLMLLIVGGFFLSTNTVQAQGKGTYSHVVLVWLKDPGNAQMRKRFIENSRALNNLPGIISRHVGVVKASDRVIVDDTFDVAVTVTLKDKAAFDAYMNNPRHKKIVEEKLKPLVNRIVAYDFTSE